MYVCVCVCVCVSVCVCVRELVCVFLSLDNVGYSMWLGIIIDTRRHTYIRTYIHTYVCMYVCTRTYVLCDMYLHTYTHTVHKYVHTILTYVHAYIQYIHTYVNTYVHTYIHDSIHSSPQLVYYTYLLVVKFHFCVCLYSNAWFAVDMGLWVYPSSYTLRHSRGYGRSALRNWLVQVSKDGKEWTTIRTHEADSALNDPG